MFNATAMKVKWAPPSYTGGVQLTGYRVRMDEYCDGTFEQVRGGLQTTSLVWVGLTPMVEYCFTVAARNVEGYAPPSQSSTSVSTTGVAPAQDSVAFTTTLDLPFAQWGASRSGAVKASVAAHLGALLSKVAIRSVREGSTIIDLDVVSDNPAVSAHRIILMQEAVAGGGLQLGGANVTSVSPPVRLVANGPTIMTVNPNLIPADGGVVSVMYQADFGVTGLACGIAGKA